MVISGSFNDLQVRGGAGPASASSMGGGPGTFVLYDSIRNLTSLTVDNYNIMPARSDPEIIAFNKTFGSVAWLIDEESLHFSSIGLVRGANLAIQSAQNISIFDESVLIISLSLK